MALEVFQKHFYTEHTDISDLLNSLTKDNALDENEQKLKLSSQYEAISNRVEILQKYFTENTPFIPIFEVRKAQEYLTKLSRLAQEKRDQIFPKKKFGFKSKQKMTTLETTIQKGITDSAAKAIDRTIDKSYNLINFENSCNIKDLDGVNLIKYEEEINGKDIGIVNAKNSTIQLLGNPSVVHMSNIESCTILCGPATGSSFISDCSNSKIVIASHQIRIHETKNTQFYIHVGSRAIIENCSNVTFSPYSWTYTKLNTHLDMSGLKADEYCWKLIDDFNWLNQDQKSPNWAFSNEIERLSWSSDDKGELKIIKN